MNMTAAIAVAKNPAAHTVGERRAALKVIEAWLVEAWLAGSATLMTWDRRAYAASLRSSLP